MSAREEIAAAASTVDGLSVTPYYQQSTRTGDGFVRLDERVRDESGFGFMDTWHVVITLGQDMTSAERWIEDNSSVIINALKRELEITSLIPTEILVGATVLSGIIVVGNREHN